MARGIIRVETLVLWIIWCVGCAPTNAPEEPKETDKVTVAQLWSDSSLDGEWVDLEETLVVSGRTLDNTRFFVQEPHGGNQSGLAVDLLGTLLAWSPSVGSRVSLSGTVSLTDIGPTLELADQDDGQILAEGEQANAVAYSDDSEMIFALVAVADVTVTSMPDPHGRADTDKDFGLERTFGVDNPGWQTVGNLVGVITTPGRVSLRSTGDWSGIFNGLDPVVSSIEALQDGEIADGVPVEVPGVTQATPWSRGGRFVVLQDELGNGIWLDAEGWSDATSQPGDTATWTGELRTDDEGPRLRSWFQPELVGSSAIITTDALSDGAILSSHTATVVEGPDDLGEWTTAEGHLLDDRFIALDDIGDSISFTGAVRITNDGTVRLCPTEILP
jgi:hypothetical protein